MGRNRRSSVEAPSKLQEISKFSVAARDQDEQLASMRDVYDAVCIHVRAALATQGEDDKSGIFALEWSIIVL
jgi:hypothetical protein